MLGHADWETGPNGGSPDGFDIAVLTDEYGSSFTAADALAACNAIDSYLSSIGKSGWPLNIGIGTGTGTATKPDTILAAKTTTGSCQAP